MSFSTFERGDIITVELPFSDYSASKLRPVLVVSSPKFNRGSSDLIVAKITGTEYKSDYVVALDKTGLQYGKLKKKSYIDAGFLFTVEKSLVNRKIARVTEQVLSEVLLRVGWILQ